MMQWSKTPHQKPRLTRAYVMAQPPANGIMMVASANGNTCQFRTENATKCMSPKPIAEIHIAGMINLCLQPTHWSSVVDLQISQYKAAPTAASPKRIYHVWHLYIYQAHTIGSKPTHNATILRLNDKPRRNIVSSASGAMSSSLTNIFQEALPA